jgi:transposase
MVTDEQRAHIRRLYFAEHWKVGTIAAELGVHHDTVRGALEMERFVRTTARVRPSMLDPYRELITQTLAQHPKLRATRLYEMLKARGYQGSALQVRRYVARHRPVAAAEAYLRLATLPGEQAQVDWAHFGRLRIGGAERPLCAFVLVLSWSRALYARFVLEQSLESFLRCHTLAFQALGGVPRSLLYDNLKSVVLERVGDHIRFHPKLLEFAGHYHFAPKPCAPYRGNEKGKVERSIHYLRHSFFAARTYSSLDDLNAQLSRWIEDTAHARTLPGDTSRRVHQALEEERPRLLPLPENAFSCDVVRTLHSGKTPYVRFDGNDVTVHQFRR